MARKNNGEPKTFAYEEFMARARKEGRVRNEELSMKVLKPDLSLQARVNHIDVDHVRALHDILKNGQPLAPIIVFEIEELKGKAVVKTFKIADGFHRHEVYKREGLAGIPCIVVSGTLQEAIEYAASANQTLSLKRSREDIRKAVWLLLENGWLDRSAMWIGKIVGISGQSVTKYKAEYCQSKNVTMPEQIVGENGKRCGLNLTLRGGKPYIHVDKKGGLRTSIGGKQISLGTTKTPTEIVDERFRKAWESTPCSTPSPATRMKSFSSLIAFRGLSSSKTGLPTCIGGYIVGEFGVATNDLSTTESTLAAAIKAMAIVHHTDAQRAVVVRHGRTVQQSAVETLIVDLGVEFMTLDEFVAAVKAEQAETAVAR